MKARRSKLSCALALALAAGVFAAAAIPAAAAEGDDDILTFFEVERLEYRAQAGRDAWAWDAEGWIGEDYNKLWIKTEGVKPVGADTEEAEIQLLYSRLISDFFDVQAGLRQDFAPDPDRTHAVIGIKGLAPHFFELDAAAFVSHKGELAARLKADYELLLTQRLILEPSVELNWSGQTVAARGIGAGLTDYQIGLRLRYEIRREIAPYLGIQWERKTGETADLARDEGERVEELSLLMGLRFWF